jgi:GTP cyclohydrolase I
VEKKKLEKLKRAVVGFLEAVGEDPTRPGLEGTPDRVARMCQELFSGVLKDPETELKLFVTKNEDEMILVKEIPFYSICEHHLLPFFGKAHIAYVPRNNLIAGFSSLVKVIDILSKRPQVQERLTTDIADLLVRTLKPLGVLVVIEAEHLCMTMRGVKKPGSLTVTSAMRGIMRKQATRSEAFALIKGK